MPHLQYFEIVMDTKSKASIPSADITDWERQDSMRVVADNAPRAIEAAKAILGRRVEQCDDGEGNMIDWTPVEFALHSCVPGSLGYCADAEEVLKSKRVGTARTIGQGRKT